MLRLSPFIFTPLALLLGCSGSERSGPPNIIYILADDLGYGELGSYGQEKINTPHLDRLASEGMRFTNHYSGSAVCAPTRCILLTGKHSGHAAIRGNDEMNARGDVWNDPSLEGQRPLPAEEKTIGELLQERGYQTGFVGKWGLGWTQSEGDPNEQGFDFFFGYTCQREAHNYYPTHLWKNQKRFPLNNSPFPSHQIFPEGEDASNSDSYQQWQQKDYAPDFMIEEALGFIREKKKEPFCLVYATPIPHLALQVPEDSLAPYPEEWDQDSPYLGTAGYLPNFRPRAAYAAMISRMDENVGKILDELERNGLEENTIVFFGSDNGPTWVGGVDREFFQSTAGLRGRKAQLYEGGIRVPFLARWPGKISAGSQSNHISAQWDFPATALALAGSNESFLEDGLSLLPTLLGNPEEQKQHDFLYWETGRKWQAIRMGDWKALRIKPNAPLQLFNLDSDPNETTDLASQEPGLSEELNGLMKSARTPSVHFSLIKKPQ
ncbi:MAG TPA: arylsulfatase [Planctomycetota bacterium]|jgi:arylsulfatase|nr:N-acetylgalactosamine-6-sulfatase [Planctomycetota bacterium]MDP7245385.1 arylsulfatase [Planctomycetota bacterium]HJM39639.1 arylsulfatase [Planctomycetota bacterium]|tara:strand:- start:6065 stop:7543 length:1479 start_codon:yes stop_codon:yes gene_type:complete